MGIFRTVKAEEGSKTNILVTLDSRYVPPLCVMLRSLAQTNPDTDIRVYVAYVSLTEADFAAMRGAVQDSSAEIVGIPLSDELFSDAPVCERFTRASYYRLLASEYLPAELSRILYLDPDILIRRSLADFYDMDFNGKLYLGAGHLGRALNSFNLARLRIPRGYTYINSGVLLLNLELLRREFSAERVFGFIRNKAKHLYMVDQDTLNALYYDRMGAVDPVLYNFCELNYRRLCRKMGAEKARVFVENNTVIIHYSGKCKPWLPDYKGALNAYYPSQLRESVSSKKR